MLIVLPYILQFIILILPFKFTTKLKTNNLLKLYSDDIKHIIILTFFIFCDTLEMHMKRSLA